MKKESVIIDTDPGVDDSAAVLLSLYDEKIDIKLITTVSGNVGIDMVTKNAIHLLELFKRTDIPLARGAAKPMCREPKDATYMHQKFGMGGYIPPEKVKTKPIKKDAVEALYETIKKHKNDISLIVLGPHTNIGNLIQKHPDVVDMISHIYCEGCSLNGYEKGNNRWTSHLSFNVSSDPEAFYITTHSGIPMTIVPSKAGREFANFTEQQVYDMALINDTGKFLSIMYSGYWERNYEDKRVATNDTCAVLACRSPEYFKTEKITIDVDTTDAPGKTTIKKDKNSNIELVVGVDKERLHKFYFDAIKKMDNFKLDNLDEKHILKK